MKISIILIRTNLTQEIIKQRGINVKRILISLVLISLFIAGCSGNKETVSSNDSNEKETELQNKSSDSSDNSVKKDNQQVGVQTYTLNEVKGKAVEVIMGINAVEIKKADIPGANFNSRVYIETPEGNVELSYEEEYDSFRNIQIKNIDLNVIKSGTIYVEIS